MRAALYARYSSDNQRYESISGQFHCSENYCKRKGYNIVHYYYDEAKSGTTIAGRDQFNQMIADAARDIFDVIVFYQIDRIARNEMDYYASVNKLLALGIRYEYSKDFFTSLNVKVSVNKINAEIQLNLSVFPFVVALKLYIGVGKLYNYRFTASRKLYTKPRKYAS